MSGTIFINYRRDDSSGTAGRLYDRLAKSFGRNNLFMDVDHIPAGVDFVMHLNNQVAACSILLVVIGPHWLDVKDENGRRRLHQPDDFVAIEIAAALARDIRVIPVLIDGASMPKASELPDSLKPLVRRQAVEVRQLHFGRDADALVERIREALGGNAAVPSRWRMGTAIGAVTVAALLLISVGGYAFIRHIVEQDMQQAELKQDEERKAAQAQLSRKAAEQQRLAGANEEPKAAAEAKAKSNARNAAQQRSAVANLKALAPRSWIGVRIQQVSKEIADSLGIPARGALVADVDDKGPAKSAGIEQGDVLIKFDGQEITEVRDVPRIVAGTPIGKEAQVVIIRKGTEYVRTVKIGQLTAEAEEKRKADEAEQQRLAALRPEENRKQAEAEARARASKAIDRGLAATGISDWDGAIANFSEAMQFDPSSAQTFFYRGLAYEKKLDNDRAIPDFTEAIRLNPKDGRSFLSRGFAYAKKRDYDRAIADYNEGIRLVPNNSVAFWDRGLAYLNKGDYDRAIADCNEAVRLDPKDARVLNDRGVAYQRKGDNDRAIADYDEAIRLDPKNTLALMNRGILYVQKGYNDRAIADLNEVIRHQIDLPNKESARAYCNRGIAKVRIHNESGRADIAKARQLDGSVCQPTRR